MSRESLVPLAAGKRGLVTLEEMPLHNMERRITVRPSGGMK